MSNILYMLSVVALVASCCLATTQHQQQDRVITGHRLIRSDRDLDLYLLREGLPTLLLVHSSNENDCDASQANCGELFADFKQAAADTKGYIRFATIDMADADAAQLAQNVLKMTTKPPMLLAFPDKADPASGGRPAMKLQTQPKPSLSQLKRIAGDLLPADVHRSKTLGDFEALVSSSIAKKTPIVALFAPKLSDKPTPMIKASWALLKGLANLTLIDYSTPQGQEILKSVPPSSSSSVNETFLVGVSEDLKMVRSNETTPLSPDALLDFASSLRIKSKTNKQQTTKKDKPIPGVYSNITQDEFDRLVMRPNTATVCAVRVKRSNETFPKNATSLTWPMMASQSFSQFGIHSAVVHCDHPSNPPKVCSTSSSNDWIYQVYAHRPLSKKDRKILTVNSLEEAVEKASASLVEGELAEEDAVDTFESGTSAVDFLNSMMAAWANPSLKSRARIPLVYLDTADTTEVPKYLLAAHASMRSIARIVRLRNPSKEVMKQLHLDPSVTFLPVLIAYAPHFEEVPVVAEEKEKKKGGGQKKQTQMSYHVVPYDTKMGALQYETSVLFIQDILSRVDQERWQEFIENTFPITAPPAISNPILERFSKKSSRETTSIPQPLKAHDRTSLQEACASSQVCIVIFADKFEGSREQAIEEARRGLEKSGMGGGVRFALVDGSCHGRVVEALGGDPTMLPVVSAWSQAKNSFSTMRGSFNSDAIQSFVRTVKRGGMAVTPIKTNPVDVFTADLKECGGGEGFEDNHEEDDLMKELREEAEREITQKEIARKQAEEESKRLKEQRDTELKAQREKLNKLAEQERLAKKKAQQDLDEQRLLKKKEQMRLDEERLMAAKNNAKKTEL